MISAPRWVAGTDRALSTVIPFLLCTLLVSACADPESPAQRIRAMIAAAESSIEARSLIDTGEYISSSFRDDHGRGRKELLQLLAGRFLRHRNVHLLVQIHRIQLENDQRAKVVLFVAMAGSTITGIEGLGTLRADLYRFDLMLQEEDGQWRVTSGSWRHGKREDFLG